MSTGSLSLYRSGLRGLATSPFTFHRLTITQVDGAWRDPAVQRLEELIRLEPGWDGYDGQPVSLANATFALRVLEATCNELVEAPQIVPGANGEIQMEWHTDQGDVEILVRAPYDVYAWRYVVGGDPDGQEVNLTNDFIQVAEWIQEVMEPQIAHAAAA